MPMMFMDPATRTFRNTPLKVQHIILFIVAVCLSLALVTASGAWNARTAQLNDTQKAMANLAQTLASQVEASIFQADILLFGLVNQIEADGLSPKQVEKLEHSLRLQRSEMPQLHGVFVYDRDGNWIINSNGTTPANANNADREYFIYHKTHTDRGVHLGKSIRSKSTGEWILTVTRRLDNPDGSFAGVALATIYLNHFLKLYNSIDVGKNGVISLMSMDAKIIVRRPFKEEDIGTDLSKGPLFSQLLPNAPSGTAISVSSVDQVERIVGFRVIDPLPLIIFIAVDKHESLAQWREETWRSLVITLLLLSLLGVFGYRIIRLMAQQTRVQEALERAQNELLVANKSLELLALEDALTGLANRRQFDIFIENETNRARRNLSALSLLMIDVDHFKSYNDSYGHLMGDSCLRTVSLTVQGIIKRPADLAARYGGEEFAVVLPNTDSTGAFIVAENIRRAVVAAQIPHSENPDHIVTISIGVSQLTATQDATAQDLIKAADKALYIAKTCGRNMSVIVT
ncbi:MAG: sensor domain-containing diguanylate cyclase [Pseudomonas sp.]|uniref:sensor domain-containing diguanylate cyclase n=1 Tax=Pseudomonas sp. TaxID=306 RepID=UPI0033920C45